MIQVFGFTDAAALPDVVTLEGLPLELVRVGDLSALVSRDCDRSFAVGSDALWAHEHAVERAAAAIALVPARFSTRVGDDVAAAGLVERNRLMLHRLLDLVRGRVELALTLPDASAVTARGVHRGLERMAARATAPVRRGTAWTMAFLVPEADIAGFVEELRVLASWYEVAPSLTGPWPPYSFVADEDLS